MLSELLKFNPKKRIKLNELIIKAEDISYLDNLEYSLENKIE